MNELSAAGLTPDQALARIFKDASEAGELGTRDFGPKQRNTLLAAAKTTKDKKEAMEAIARTDAEQNVMDIYHREMLRKTRKSKQGEFKAVDLQEKEFKELNTKGDASKTYNPDNDSTLAGQKSVSMWAIDRFGGHPQVGVHRGANAPNIPLEHGHYINSQGRIMKDGLDLSSAYRQANPLVNPKTIGGISDRFASKFDNLDDTAPNWKKQFDDFSEFWNGLTPGEQKYLREWQKIRDKRRALEAEVKHEAVGGLPGDDASEAVISSHNLDNWIEKGYLKHTDPKPKAEAPDASSSTESKNVLDETDADGDLLTDNLETPEVEAEAPSSTLDDTTGSQGSVNENTVDGEQVTGNLTDAIGEAEEAIPAGSSGTKNPDYSTQTQRKGKRSNLNKDNHVAIQLDNGKFITMDKIAARMQIPVNELSTDQAMQWVQKNTKHTPIGGLDKKAAVKAQRSARKKPRNYGPLSNARRAASGTDKAGGGGLLSRLSKKQVAVLSVGGTVVAGGLILWVNSDGEVESMPTDENREVVTQTQEKQSKETADYGRFATENGTIDPDAFDSFNMSFKRNHPDFNFGRGSDGQVLGRISSEDLDSSFDGAVESYNEKIKEMYDGAPLTQDEQKFLKKVITGRYDESAVESKASGGYISAGHGEAAGNLSKGTDTRLTVLTPGEFVVNRQSAQKNRGLLHAINSGALYSAKGGPIVSADIQNNKMASPLYFAKGGDTKWVRNDSGHYTLQEYDSSADYGVGKYIPASQDTADRVSGGNQVVVPGAPAGDYNGSPPSDSQIEEVNELEFEHQEEQKEIKKMTPKQLKKYNKKKRDKEKKKKDKRRLEVQNAKKARLKEQKERDKRKGKGKETAKEQGSKFKPTLDSRSSDDDFRNYRGADKNTGDRVWDAEDGGYIVYTPPGGKDADGKPIPGTYTRYSKGGRPVGEPITTDQLSGDAPSFSGASEERPKKPDNYGSFKAELDAIPADDPEREAKIANLRRKYPEAGNHHFHSADRASDRGANNFQVVSTVHQNREDHEVEQTKKDEKDRKDETDRHGYYHETSDDVKKDDAGGRTWIRSKDGKIRVTSSTDDNIQGPGQLVFTDKMLDVDTDEGEQWKKKKKEQKELKEKNSTPSVGGGIYKEVSKDQKNLWANKDKYMTGKFNRMKDPEKRKAAQEKWMKKQVDDYVKKRRRAQKENRDRKRRGLNPKPLPSAPPWVQAGVERLDSSEGTFPTPYGPTLDFQVAEDVATDGNSGTSSAVTDHTNELRADNKPDDRFQKRRPEDEAVDPDIEDPTTAAFAQGGKIGGHGSHDSVPAVLTPGEFVVNRDAAKRNISLLHRLNNSDSVLKASEGGYIQRFNGGGGVEPSPLVSDICSCFTNAINQSSLSNQPIVPGQNQGLLGAPNQAGVEQPGATNGMQNFNGIADTLRSSISEALSVGVQLSIPEGFASSISSFGTSSAALTEALSAFKGTVTHEVTGVEGLSNINVTINGLEGLEDSIVQKVTSAVIGQLNSEKGKENESKGYGNLGGAGGSGAD